MFVHDTNSISDNIPAMSTALVSAFYDVREVLYQNRKNDQLKTHCVMERRATIGASTNLTQNRNLSTGAFIPLSKPQSIPVTGHPTTLISNLNRDTTQVREHRKLDRSMSEPVGDRNLNNLNRNRVQQQLQPQEQPPNINSSRYKTELCRPFEESGHCKYGDKCQFAHGGLELRTLSRHPKYKTELCRTYHTIGFCPYGPRCHFIHNEEERKLALAMEAQQQQQQNAAASQAMVSRHSPTPSVPSPQLKRPSTINFNSSFNGSMGSTDSISTPSSASESPSLSPTLFTEELLHGLQHVSTHHSSASSSTSSSPVFNYSSSPEFNYPSLLTPLNVQTQGSTDMNMLQQQFNAILNISQNQQNNNQCVFTEMDSFVAPPSPPDSISGDSVGSASSLSSNASSGFTNTCGTVLDISKSLRLPIFNRLSQDD
ncbi:mRNA decay activator protein ZFP36L2-A-like [Mizuhopecten yessoensis]|uniref:Zinc finger protein 36, C3H1 type-like 2-A n=1 Tax=Mizuhopecten yessoensis TaxID=6573 RepID=A0A210QPR4_MIZYE|nr:mRNA decay activator protein ZFP36L2-A-like [Mizuhopecten yessoensis]OWF50730.1 Zinc finger protein 36, C3H1 type-like 2-A [Mizuhopecten yessoensis]